MQKHRAPVRLLVLPPLMAAMASLGCRPVEPSRFTPSAEVTALTDDLEDEDEIKLYRDLQNQIGDTLRLLCGVPDSPKLLGADAESMAAGLERGAAIFAMYCVQCHGVNGDGRGELAAHLDPRPRDYTQGIFKFTSTSNGKARRADLIETLRRGVRGTSMPSFAALSDNELGDVADYVLALAHRGELQRMLAQIAFDDGELPEGEDLDGVVDEILTPWREANSSVVMPLTPMPPMTEESIAQGHELFLKFACSRCHGVDGRGGSLGNVDVGTDAWGRKAAAADLTSGMFHGGGRPVDLYRRIYAGITGSPMPGFATQFASDPDAIWKLVHYVKDAGQRRRRRLPPAEVTTSPGVSPASPEGDVPSTDDGPAEPDDDVDAEA